MDRFIEAGLFIYSNSKPNLKSNMDRFIGKRYEQLSI